MPQNLAFPYPEKPQTINKEILEASPEFRKEVKGVFSSILFFFFTYVLLIIAAVALSILCGYGGILLIQFRPGLATLAIGLGLIAFGVMVIVFLVKFISKTSSTSLSPSIEITQKDQHHLFEFINKIAVEIGITPPKHIYLSNEVNACVYYKSGFWSMFLPGGKQLQIGLGAVNNLSISEFKALIAHEFGHFSQRSMKLGSYVYNVNKMIHDMLYDNREYNRSLQSFANVSPYFSFFTVMTEAVVDVIQSILKKQYLSINERYMALSRQMEYHADTVAASVSGSEAAITLLQKIEVSSRHYHQLLLFYDNWRDQNIRPLNIYTDHLELITYFTQSNKESDEADLTSEVPYSTKSRIVIEDIYASHPDNSDRETHLKTLNLSADSKSESAWLIFSDASKLQEQVTNLMYEEIVFRDSVRIADHDFFKTTFYNQIKINNLDKRYKGFYDDRDIKEFDIEKLAKEPIKLHSLGEILTTNTIQLPSRILQFQYEIELLESIRQKSSQVKRFIFKDKEYLKREAQPLINLVHKELTDTKRLIDQVDQQLFQLYYSSSVRKGNGQQAISDYQHMFSVSNFTIDELKKVDDVITEVSQLYRREVTIAMAHAINDNMLRKEVPIKTSIKQLLTKEEFVPFYSSEEKAMLSLFTSQNRSSYAYPRIDSEAINAFMNCMQIYKRIVHKYHFFKRKELLTKQIETIES